MTTMHVAIEYALVGDAYAQMPLHTGIAIGIQMQGTATQRNVDDWFDCNFSCHACSSLTACIRALPSDINTLRASQNILLAMRTSAKV